MKNGKRPTLKQKIVIRERGLNPKNWLVTKNANGELHLVHRETGTQRIINV